MFIKKGRVCRRTTKGFGIVPENPDEYRNWWLIKNPGVVQLGNVRFPKEFIGKKVRFKIEIVEDENALF